MKALTHKFIIGSLVIGISFVMLMPVMAISPSAGSHVNPQVTSGANFSFPYQYGTPTVPSDVGAQGVQGPTVPTSDIGLTLPVSQIGYQGHIGPVNQTTELAFPYVPSILTVTVRNGTISSSTPAIGVTINLINITFGTEQTTSTNISGIAVFNANEGWFIIQAIATTTSYISIDYQLHVTGSSVSLTLYLMPSSYSKANVGNGGTDNVWFGAGAGNYWDPTISQIEIELLNESASGAVVGTAYTLNNGSAEFTNVSPSYSYAIYMDGFSNSLTGIRYGLINQTTSNFSPNTATFQSPSFNVLSTTTTTATVTGTPITGTTTYISLTTNTTISGGTTYLGSFLYTNSHDLTIQNAVVYLNYTGSTLSNGAGEVRIVNSTIINLASTYSPRGQLYFFAPNQTIADHSDIFGSGAFSGTNIEGAPFIANNSVIDYVANFFNNGNGVQPGAGTYYTNDYLSNDSWEITTPSAWSPGTHSRGNNPGLFLPRHVDHVTICNSEVMLDGNNSNWSYSRFSNDSLVESNYQSSHSYGLTVYDSEFGPFSDNLFSIYGDAYGGNWSRDLFNFSAPSNIPFSGYMPNNRTVSWHFPNGANITDSLFVSSQIPRLAVNFLLNDTMDYIGKFENNIMNYYTSPGIVLKWADNSYIESGLNPGINFGTLTVGTNYTVSHNTFNRSALQIGISNKYYVTNEVHVANNIFSGQFSPQDLVVTSFPGPANDVVFSNNTWESVFTSYYFLVQTSQWQNGGGIGGYGSLNTLDADAYQEYVTVTHNNFYGLETGGGEPGAVGNDVGWWLSNITDNIWYNNASYGNSSGFIGAQQFDIWENGLHNGGSANISGNWFLNLDNQTAAIAIGTTTRGTNSHFTSLNINHNHYYYNPLVIAQTYGASYVPILRTPGSSYTSGNFTYGLVVSTEQPLGANINVTGPQYVFNTSSTYVAAGQNNWFYTIAPDVNTLSGTPTISYANGLVGGPQPNFTWQGYKYTESVEPTYIKIGVNSSKAPPVDLLFNNLQKSTAYIVYIYNNGTIWKDWAFNSNSSTNYTVTYNPANMPLDPTILVVPWTAPPPAPPSPSGPVTLKSVGNGLLSELEQPYVFVPLGIFIIGAIVLVSVGRRR